MCVCLGVKILNAEEEGKMGDRGKFFLNGMEGS